MKEQIQIEHNKILVNDIRNYLLTRKLQDRVGNTCGTIEKICMFRLNKLLIFIINIIFIKQIYNLGR